MTEAQLIVLFLGVLMCAMALAASYFMKPKKIAGLTLKTQAFNFSLVLPTQHPSLVQFFRNHLFQSLFDQTEKRRPSGFCL